MDGLNLPDLTPNFYPRSPRGERRCTWCRPGRQPQISIHAPREGSDPAFLFPVVSDFISIHAPREGSDRIAFQGLCQNLISIHAPREGSDLPDERFQAYRDQISIHAPREGSDSSHFSAFLGSCSFLSTLPARGATQCSHTNRLGQKFLSTLPARGATV